MLGSRVVLVPRRRKVKHERCSHKTLKGERCKNKAKVGNACLVHLRQVIREVASDPNNTWRKQLRGEWRLGGGH